MNAVTLSAAEIHVREQFVAQFMREFDPFQAALRMGYGEQAAKGVSGQFMLDQYVLNRIEEEKDKLGVSTEEEVHRRRIIAGLYREANSKHNSGGARVSALTQLSKIIGIEAPLKVDNTVHGDEGEFLFKIVDARAPSA